MEWTASLRLALSSSDDSSPAGREGYNMNRAGMTRSREAMNQNVTAPEGGIQVRKVHEAEASATGTEESSQVERLCVYAVEGSGGSDAKKGTIAEL